MNFFESLPYSELAKLAMCSPEALKQRVYRNKVTKAQAVSDCSGILVTLLEAATTMEELEQIFKTEIPVERTFSRRYAPSYKSKSEKEEDSVTHVTHVTEFKPVSVGVSEEVTHVTPKVTDATFDVTSLPATPVTEVTPEDKVTSNAALDEMLQQPAQQVVTVIRSDILAVTAMLVLSVLIAVSFTAKIFIASGVVPIAAYVMSILLDFTMIVFVFRGHTQIAWLFGVNVFAQVALTTSARMFLSFMSESTLVGIKGLLVAFSIVIAIKGLSDFVQQNFK